MAKKNNNNSMKLLEGAIAGIALGVGASIFLASKKGKEIKGDVHDMLADFYKYISPKIKMVKKMGEKEYKEFMKMSAEKYAKAKKMSEAVTKEFVKEAQQSWKHLSKHL
jgi:gas vesicle protein